MYNSIHAPFLIDPIIQQPNTCQVGQIPVLDKLLGKNPYCPIKFADFSVSAGYCVQRFMERMQNPSAFQDKDFVNGFLAAKKEYPDLVSDTEVIGYMIINVRSYLLALSLSHFSFS